MEYMEYNTRSIAHTSATGADPAQLFSLLLTLSRNGKNSVKKFLIRIVIRISSTL